MTNRASNDEIHGNWSSLNSITGTAGQTIKNMHYPPKSYQRLYDSSVDSLWSATAGLSPAEDGDHYRPEKDFFEWWYFDAAFDNGYVLVAIFHSSLYNAADHKPTLDLRVYTPQGERVLGIQRYNREEFTSRRDRCELQLGNCRVNSNGSHYQLALREGDIEADLTFSPQLPGWRPGSGYLFYDEASKRFFKWIVPIPAATVTGSLGLAGSSFPVQGTGYHDHNWGNMYLPTAFNHWTWGRVLADDWAVIFGDVVGPGPQPLHVTPFMLARGNEILLETNHVNIRGQEPVQEPQTGANYFHQLHLTTTEGPAVELTLTADRSIEALDFAAPHLLLAGHRYLRGAAEIAFYLSQNIPVANRLAAWMLGKGSYLRLESDYQLCLPDYATEKTGRALYEIMVF